MMPEHRVVGRRISRVDGYQKASGQSRYFDDLVAPRMLYARLVRSSRAHARVKVVDASDALDIPGVAAVISSDNLVEMIGEVGSYDPACHDFERESPFAPQPGDARLFDDTVRYVGQPVAMILAESDRAALLAKSSVRVEYEELVPVVTLDEAGQAGAPQLHENGLAGNVVDSVTLSVGNIEEGFDQAAILVSQVFTTPRQKQAQLEPTGCLVVPRGDGEVIISAPHQAPHRARITLARMFGLRESQVRVVNPDIGGAFGKGDALTAEPYALAGCLATGRPVKLRFARDEDFLGTEARHSGRLEVAIGVRSDGKLSCLRVRALVDAGAYRSHTPRVLRVIANQFLATYAIPNADIAVTARFTNTPVAGAFRGYGGPQAVLALEHVLDLASRRLELDPLEFRLMNMKPEGEPWGPKGRPLDTTGLQQCIEVGAEAIGWNEQRAEAATNSRRSGYGMACTAWKSGTAGKPGSIDHSGAIVRFGGDGTVDLRTAASELGTGVKTTLAQICAEVLGIEVEDVRVSWSDTSSTPFDSGAHASRSLYRCGQAVLRAAFDARQRLLDFASSLLEADAEDLTITDRNIHVIGAPERSGSIEYVLRRALAAGVDVHGEGYTEEDNAITYSAHFALVEVDLETGFLDVVRLVAVQDVGTAINPTIVEGQIQGGALQGIAYALWEDLVIDESGSVLNGTFMDYRVPYAGDGPVPEAILVEVADPSGPFGAKGAGEPSIMLPAPAIMNAVLDATGTCPTRLPLTPERVLESLDDLSVSSS